jgi:hypothetical protein
VGIQTEPSFLAVRIADILFSSVADLKFIVCLFVCLITCILWSDQVGIMQVILVNVEFLDSAVSVI